MGLLSGFFGPPSHEAFAKAAIEALRESGVREAIEFDPTTYSLRVEVGSGQEMVYLGNWYDRYCKASRKERREVLDAFVAHRAAKPPYEKVDLAEARERLLPVVRSLAYYDFSNLRMELQGFPPAMRVMQRLGRHVAVGLVLDFPDTSRHVNPPDLEEWGITFEDALATARANLLEISREPFHKVMDGVYVAPWEDSYAASRILLPELFTSLQVQGAPVALIPTRDLLIVAGSEDRTSLAAAATIAREALGDPYSISLFPLVLKDGAWSDHTIDDRDLAAAFYRLTLDQLIGDYDEQQKLLNAVFDKRGEGAYVSKFLATQHQESGEVSTFCTWSNSEALLLPETDRVAFSRVTGESAESLGIARWEKVRTVMGDRMRATEHYPPRWEVREFPTAEEIGRMVE